LSGHTTDFNSGPQQMTFTGQMVDLASH